nr:MAG TPA: YopX protein [Caudoviricetes sp.]
MSVSVSVHKEMTVIGNIHENPEMLEAHNGN